MEDTTEITVPEVPVEAPKPGLSEEQILAAATNAPEISPDQFKLGNRVFKIVHLPYDDYVLFLGYLQPFLGAIVSKKSADSKVSIPGIDLGVAADSNTLMRFCNQNLPEMVRIVCKQTDAAITIETIKELAGNPFVLCGVIFQQLARNQMIADFVSFFKQVTPLLRAVK